MRRPADRYRRVRRAIRKAKRFHMKGIAREAMIRVALHAVARQQ